MTTFNISAKTMAALPSMDLTKAEVENIAQAFGLRLLDWRRFTDQQASDWLVALLNRHGAEHLFNALTRVRRLAGRERGFWLASISVVDPKQAPFLKNPPEATDDEIWRMAFLVFMSDEINKTLQRLDKQVMEAAISEQM